MTSYLIFNLYAPLASWGQIAVGSERSTSANPTRSAMLGLIGAAAGLRRADTELAAAFFRGYQFGSKVFSSGSLLLDYHTVQMPKENRKSEYLTRRDEIVRGRERLAAMLTSREYRMEALTAVAVRALSGAPYTLEDLCQYLERPRFVLYLGRKSCPPSAPLGPRVVQAQGFRSALDQVVWPKVGNAKPASPEGRALDEVILDASPGSQFQYFWEGEDSELEAIRAFKTEVYDDPVNRVRWQFAPRTQSSCAVAREVK